MRQLTNTSFCDRTPSREGRMLFACPTQMPQAQKGSRQTISSCVCYTRIFWKLSPPLCLHQSIEPFCCCLAPPCVSVKPERLSLRTGFLKHLAACCRGSVPHGTRESSRNESQALCRQHRVRDHRGRSRIAVQSVGHG